MVVGVAYLHTIGYRGYQAVFLVPDVLSIHLRAYLFVPRVATEGFRERPRRGHTLRPGPTEGVSSRVRRSFSQGFADRASIHAGKYSVWEGGCVGATGLASESEAPCEKALRPLASYSHRRAGARCVVPVCGSTARLGPGSGSSLQVLGALAPVDFPLRSLAS